MTRYQRDELRRMADDVVPHWWHSIDLGEGVVTPGRKDAATMRREIAALRLPEDLAGRSVLDIGAWDGAFSFECERRGADRVVALDHYIWSMDLAAKLAYDAACERDGVEPRPYEELSDVWRPEDLPGRRGFDVAHQARGSKVEARVGELEVLDLAELGSFDIVLYLGVLYHVLDPYLALRRLASVTRDLAVIETELFCLAGRADRDLPLYEFIPGSGLNADPTNYWVPNIEGLEAMCLASGFRSAETFIEPFHPASGGLGGWAARGKYLARHTVDRVRGGEEAPQRRWGLIRFRAVTHARR
ncbi:MAG: methyltransferase domain-containing protein [Acidimicrobiales bacterium]|nr:methyltransferase domain-containing protein [Acidimicrobiales bacterium]